jgi:hypothetical protein
MKKKGWGYDKIKLGGGDQLGPGLVCFPSLFFHKVSFYSCFQTHLMTVAPSLHLGAIF